MRKGEGNTAWIVIGLLLALMALLMLIFGLGFGWEKFWGGVSGQGSSSNIDMVKQTCQRACDSLSKYEYCVLKRNIVVFDKEGKVDRTSYKEKSCKEMEFYGAGFQSCPSIDCTSLESSSGNLNTASEVKAQELARKSLPQEVVDQCLSEEGKFDCDVEISDGRYYAKTQPPFIAKSQKVSVYKDNIAIYSDRSVDESAITGEKIEDYKYYLIGFAILALFIVIALIFFGRSNSPN